MLTQINDVLWIEFDDVVIVEKIERVLHILLKNGKEVKVNSATKTGREFIKKIHAYFDQPET